LANVSRSEKLPPKGCAAAVRVSHGDAQVQTFGVYTKT